MTNVRIYEAHAREEALIVLVPVIIYLAIRAIANCRKGEEKQQDGRGPFCMTLAYRVTGLRYERFAPTSLGQYRAKSKKRCARIVFPSRAGNS
jgi:hypothetical protein